MTRAAGTWQQAAGSRAWITGRTHDEMAAPYMYCVLMPGKNHAAAASLLSMGKRKTYVSMLAQLLGCAWRFSCVVVDNIV